MRILFLSFYFQPDLCAGSFRNSPLVEILSKKMRGKGLIDVYSTMPNRYSTFEQEAKKVEKYDNVIINRIELPKHKNGFLDQIISFKTYFSNVLKQTRHKDYDVIYASSSRLFTAYLGAQISKKKNVPLFLDIRDLFRENMEEIISNPIIKKPLIPFLKYIESKTFKHANHINMVSEGFKTYFEKYDVTKSYLTNGIDDVFINFPDSNNELTNKKPYLITYAGNMGEGQGLHKIIPDLALKLGDNYVFQLIGDGGTKKLLEDKIKEYSLKNVILRKPVTRKELIDEYKKSHYLFVHLNDYKAFEKVLPSKLFEYGATDKPIIAGLGGYSNKFVDSYISNVILFHPTDFKEAAKKLKNYSFKFEKRDNFVSKFKRNTILSELADLILSIKP